MPTTRLYLLRHSETTWNAIQRVQGAQDSPLSATGQAQAAAAARALARAPLVAVYASPLRRAIETAQRIASVHQLQVTPLPGLHELHQGVWESLTLAQLETQYGALLQQWWDRPETVRVPGGETVEEVRDRAMAAVDDMVRHHPGETIGAVAHGGVNKAILLTVLGAPLSSYWRLRQRNACINVLEFDDERARLVVLNYTRHCDEAI